MKTAEYSFEMLEPFDEKRNVWGTSVCPFLIAILKSSFNRPFMLRIEIHTSKTTLHSDQF